jgi:hypothetical protein
MIRDFKACFNDNWQGSNHKERKQSYINILGPKNVSGWARSVSISLTRGEREIDGINFFYFFLFFI